MTRRLSDLARRALKNLYVANITYQFCRDLPFAFYEEFAAKFTVFEQFTFYYQKVLKK